MDGSGQERREEESLSTFPLPPPTGNDPGKFFILATATKEVVL